jgi:hypothetical protein
MCEMKINIQLDGVKNHIHVKNVSEDFLKDVTSKFFAALGTEQVLNEPVTFSETIEMIKPFQVIPDVVRVKPEINNVGGTLSKPKQLPEINNIEGTLSRPKQLPLINSERSLSVPLGEVVKTDEPEYYKTGIKLFDGVKHYKTRYFCAKFDCNDQGNHYLPEGTETTYCRKCNAQLEVRPASEEGFPVRDSFGNFYIADHLTEDEVYS